jgi:hypothetical protein
VTVPGGVASPELQTVTRQPVEAAMHEIGLVQGGNTLQIRGLR